VTAALCQLARKLEENGTRHLGTAMHLWADTERDPNTLQTHFLAGGVLHGLAVRTGRDWRLSELSLRNTWRTGSGYAAMLVTGR
jgi:hypothetical protein